MAKKSKQRSVRQKKDQSGCMWGLISMFDFRHHRTPKRLPSDRRRYAANNAHGSPYPTSESNLPSDSEEMRLRMEDGGKIKNPSFDLMRTRVKELIEEEMFVDQDPKKQTDTNKLESESNSRAAKHKHKYTERTSKKSFDQENGISIANHVSGQKTSQYHDLEALVKEILLIYRKKNEQHDDLDPGAKRSFPIAEEKLIAAVEVLLKEKSSDLKNHHSKEMFQMLSSNKEMFLKLLHDQNSVLLHEERKSKSKSTESSNFLEPETTDQEPEDPVARKHRKFFRRRSKSHESISLSGKDKIVLLKPGSPENKIPIGNDIHNEGNASHFSLMEIKRRLKHAMGKDQRASGPSERTGKTIGDGGWSSPNRDHFYTERFTRVTNRLKTGDRISKLRDSERNSEDVNHRISNIYVEAKKHLSEMLTSGDEDAELMMRSLPKSLGRILSLREFNGLSPGTSPRAQMSPSSRMDQTFITKDKSEEKTEVVDQTTSEGVQEIIKPPVCDKENEEQTESVDVLSEPCASSNGVDDNNSGVISDGFNEERSSESLKPDSPDEKELSSSRAQKEPSVCSKTEELETTPRDRAGKPSPISVLEPLFSDDDISPARTVIRPVEADVQPLCIRFDEIVSEDQQIRITDSADTEESTFEYVEAVLLSSDLNWSEFEKRWLSSVQILDPSLFEEVETFSGRARYDQRLLFDSANESLEEVCDRFIPESRVVKPIVWPVPKGMDLINEVWSRLESRICNPYPRDLDKLVRNDLETSRTWMDLRSVTRIIVIEIEESIFEETIEDTILCLFW